MSILLTGGSGFVGSSVLTALIAAGYSVDAVVRSDEAGEKVAAAGARAVEHILPDTDWLTLELEQSDGFIHTATPDDGSGAEFDDAVIDSVIAAFAGTDKPFIYTGGVWVHGNGADITEETPISAPEITAWREERVQKLFASGINASVIEPGVVYGYGKGIPNVISGAPRTATGALTLLGTGDQHWATVHVDDLADLYVLVLQYATRGERYLGVNGESVTVRQLAEAVVGPDGEVAPGDLATTEGALGKGFTEALLLDQQASGAKARALGWNPTRPSILSELAG
ncbi:NAD-dependent epimerase/dehydratase family protein [Lacisediminihabitans changchengi]|uniref:NAD-dependent epimerase/dehydratase family protein n=1 Tax=Lacisediminihabitans changchengi TaxID=2787634 RepID=A0A934SIP2_9MICO|nr:NAD-dependent epimerase/dehydratase family protein [Lacisediminihabitans changchengi]MBK4346104.1 NAD-dependent epimerase/dehydratase family protein [Lacisediminihabitans changchengi]